MHTHAEVSLHARARAWIRWTQFILQMRKPIIIYDVLGKHDVFVLFICWRTHARVYEVHFWLICVGDFIQKYDKIKKINFINLEDVLWKHDVFCTMWAYKVFSDIYMTFKQSKMVAKCIEINYTNIHQNRGGYVIYDVMTCFWLTKSVQWRKIQNEHILMHIYANFHCNISSSFENIEGGRFRPPPPSRMKHQKHPVGIGLIDNLKEIKVHVDLLSISVW